MVLLSSEISYFFDYIFDPYYISPFIFLLFALLMGLSCKYQMQNELTKKYVKVGLWIIVPLYIILMMIDGRFFEGLGLATISGAVYWIGNKIGKNINDKDYPKVFRIFAYVALIATYIVLIACREYCD